MKELESITAVLQPNWRRNKYTHVLQIGNVSIVGYRESTNPFKSEKYEVVSSFPGINKHLGYYETSEKCENRCFNVLKVAINKLTNKGT